jgi:hypothetical protein
MADGGSSSALERACPEAFLLKTDRHARSRPSKLALCLALAALMTSAFGPRFARAQGELAIQWSRCAPDGIPDLGPECQFDVGERRLVMSFVPGAEVTQVVGWALVLDYVSDTAQLPPWWQVQPGGCRQGQMAATLPHGDEGSCLDAWSATGATVVQSVIYPRPGGDASQLRLVVGVGVPAASAFMLQAGESYLAGIVSLYFASTTGSTCPGCSTPVCFRFNSAEVQRLPGAPGPDPVPFVTASPAVGNQCSWGGGSSCAAVPVLNRTWGQIKSLYR